jgi:hypothetical protein
MADPVTIIAIVHGSIGLALKIGTIVKTLYSISQKLKNAELTLISTASECETIQIAWGRIETWARGLPDETAVEQELLDRLGQSLVVGTMVMSAFEQDILQIESAPPTRFMGRSRMAWKEECFAQHQDRIRGQVAAISLLLQVVNLYVY